MKTVPPGRGIPQLVRGAAPRAAREPLEAQVVDEGEGMECMRGHSMRLHVSNAISIAMGRG
jgi:hypothetical protein